MNKIVNMLLFAVAVVVLCMGAGQISAQMPAAIDAPGQTVVATLHAEGAQVYECKANTEGKLTWQIREPIATLFLDGRTIGRHYAGPTWEHADGSMIVGKVVGIVFGATPNDIPWLRLEVVDRRGNGMLSGVTTVQRINTKGGTAQGLVTTHAYILVFRTRRSTSFSAGALESRARRPDSLTRSCVVTPSGIEQKFIIGGEKV